MKETKGGAFTTKVSLSDSIKKYESMLAKIALVHERGARKYECYSWLNNPESSNSTIKENIDALFRHFIAHTMGEHIDVEGLPHAYHIACRSGMLISTAYRDLTESRPLTTDIRSYLSDVIENPVGHHITSEELIALSKEGLYQLPDTKHELVPLFRCLLYEASLSNFEHISRNMKNIFTDRWLYDYIFLIGLKLSEEWFLSKHQLTKLFENENFIFTEEDKSFIMTCIIGNGSDKKIVI